MGALMYRSLTRSDDPGKLAFKWILTVILLVVGVFVVIHAPPTGRPPIAAAFAIPIGIIWTKSIGEMIAAPLAGLFTGGNEPPEAVPMYSIAESKRSLSQFDQAIRLIREQLEKFPGDFQGMMLMAAIQAENLNDIQAAQTTIEHLLAGKRTPQAAASALHALADWHLRVEDPDSARAALERIVQMYPDTPVAQIAAQRIARIGTREELTAMRHQGPIKVRPGEKDIGLRTDIKPMAEADPDEIAAGYVRQLVKHPLDTETREKLAILYLEHYERPDLALDQFEQLASQPNETPRRIARWLDFVATVHLRRNDLASAEAALRRIIEKYPGTAPAQTAATRLPSLEGELRRQKASSTIKLGIYDRDIGLKG